MPTANPWAGITDSSGTAAPSTTANPWAAVTAGGLANKLQVASASEHDASGAAAYANTFQGQAGQAVKDVGAGIENIGSDIWASLTSPTPAPINTGLVTENNPTPGGQVVTTGLNSYAASLKAAADSMNNFSTTSKDPNATGLQKTVAGAGAALGGINAFLAPITAASAAAAQVPVVGHVATWINNIFGAIGTGSADAGSYALQATPFLSQDQKDELDPIVKQASALAGQIAVGAGAEGAHEAFGGKLADITNKISDAIAVKNPVKDSTGQTITPNPIVKLPVEGDTTLRPLSVTDNSPAETAVTPNKPEPLQVTPNTVFHGTKGDISDITKSQPLAYGDAQALYGPGTYLTDNQDVASGYSKTKGTGGTGKVLAGELKPDLKFLNLDQKLSPQEAQVFNEEINRPIGDLMEGDHDVTGKTGAEAIQMLRENLSEAHIPKYEAAESFYQLQQRLGEEHGYDGFAHVGGVGKGTPHNVKILFDYGDSDKPISSKFSQSHGVVSSQETTPAPSSSTAEKGTPAVENASTEPTNVPTNGNKVSGVADTIEATALRKQLVTSIPEKAGYNSSDFDTQSKMVADFINNDGIDAARAAVKDETQMPKGMKAGALIQGLELYADKNPEVATQIYREIAASHLTSTISEGASETSFARMIDRESPSMVIKDAIEKKAGGAEGAKKIAAEAKKAKSTVTKAAAKMMDYQSIIDAIKTC